MGQKLYVRLFQRKLKWLQVNRLDYEEISKDLGPVAQELVDCGFLERDTVTLWITPHWRSTAHWSSTAHWREQHCSLEGAALLLTGAALLIWSITLYINYHS
jgi:hypothetical protein